MNYNCSDSCCNRCVTRRCMSCAVGPIGFLALLLTLVVGLLLGIYNATLLQPVFSAFAVAGALLLAIIIALMIYAGCRKE